MNLQKYYQLTNGQLSVTREQASSFAKGIAGDFNPIHNIDAKRFCVPGDLLFAIILDQYGLSQQMVFSFADMVDDKTLLLLPDVLADETEIADSNGKTRLTVQQSGDQSQDTALVNSLTRAYVEFSGLTFPHVLVPLMQANNVMINTQRPLVIYEQMSITLDQLPSTDVTLQLAESEMQLEGKRADVLLNYSLIANNAPLGMGKNR